MQGLRNIDWPEAILFDCDGVLAETERDGHRHAFNEAFKSKGLGQHEWSVEEYGRLLETGGGKERMMRYFLERENEEPFKTLKGEDERRALLAELHTLKTDIFMAMVEDGRMPLRPGVRRLVGEALAGGAQVAVCSTSNERAVSTIVRVLLGDAIAQKMRVFAGDCVPKKKPDPAIYLLAAEELGVNPQRCVVIEDSRIGLLAARAAGMRCVVTTSSYTVEEEFGTADAVFDCIGDEGDERFSFHDLTTPGSFWLNPPLAIDSEGNWYSKPAAAALDIDAP